jgi:hypothetical protein
MVSVLRPGNRILNIPGIGVSTSRRAVASAVPVAVTNFFNQLYAGTRNDYTGTVGFRFTPTSDVVIVALGRPVSTTMASSHAIEIWRVSDTAKVATATVSPASDTDALGYKYAMLGTPFTALTGVDYHIVSQETAGGDQWSQLGPIENHAAIATVYGYVYGPPGDVYPLNYVNAANYGFVPPTFYI